MKLTGGYLQHRLDGMRAGAHGHSSVLECPVSAPDLAAWNAVQATPWAINTWILDVMLEGLDHGEVDCRAGGGRDWQAAAQAGR